MNDLFNEILKDIYSLVGSPILTKILLLMILTGISFTLTVLFVLFKFFRQKSEEIFRSIKYSQDYQQAMDSALEHTLKNGYGLERDRKLQVLNVKYSRVYKND